MMKVSLRLHSEHRLMLAVAAYARSNSGEYVQMQAVSVVFFTDEWRPDSFYDRILANRRQGLHTLCLLDIKVRFCLQTACIKWHNSMLVACNAISALR